LANGQLTFAFDAYNAYTLTQGLGVPGDGVPELTTEQNHGSRCRQALQKTIHRQYIELGEFRQGSANEEDEWQDLRRRMNEAGGRKRMLKDRYRRKKEDILDLEAALGSDPGADTVQDG
jgi:hypothetical protein